MGGGVFENTFSIPPGSYSIETLADPCEDSTAWDEVIHTDDIPWRLALSNAPRHRRAQRYEVNVVELPSGGRRTEVKVHVSPGCNCGWLWLSYTAEHDADGNPMGSVRGGERIEESHDGCH